MARENLNIKGVKMKIGDIIYAEPTWYGNAGRRDSRIRKFEITKVGRKWLTVKGSNEWETHRFDKRTLEHDGGNYSSEYVGYVSLQEVEDKREYKSLTEHIQENLWALDLNHLRGIMEALKGVKND